ncbi:MAG: DUF1127 domain-containing protein [Alphaproteobacteria bacterium]|nr:DUF1127 domain-containing protein [Alphaproteobacteria bacterium]
MNTIGQYAYPAPPAAPVTSSLGAAARGLGRILFQALQPRPQSDDAWALDDRMLDDIGLTRGDLLRPSFHGTKPR